MDGGSTIEIDLRFHISLFKKWYACRYACSVQLSSYGSTGQVAKPEKASESQEAKTKCDSSFLRA